MLSRVSCRIILLIAAIAYVILCWPRLPLPYFWDELGTYASTSNHLFHHGISLAPGAASPDFSFGHPLLVPAIYAITFKIFGPGIFTAHCLSLAFALMLFWATYRFGEYFFSASAGLFASLLLMAQPLIFAQSTQQVIEIPFALFTLWSVYYFLRDKLWLSVLFATAAIMTKETGLVLPLALIIAETYRLLLKQVRLRYQSFLLLIPYLVFGIFLLMQKEAHGWYLSPVNMDKTVLHFKPFSIYWDGFWERVRYCRDFILYEQGRNPWLWLALLGALVFLIRHRQNLGQVFKKSFWQNPLTFLHACIAVFAFGMLVFSSVNNPLERYLVVLFPFFCLWLVLLIGQMSPNTWMQGSLVAGLIILACLNQHNGKRYTDVDLSYVDHVKTNLALGNFLDSDTARFNGEYIYTDWPTVFYIGNPFPGYVKHPGYELKIASDSLIPKADYYVYTIPGNFYDRKRFKELELVKSFQSSYARVDLYKVNKTADTALIKTEAQTGAGN